MWKKEQSKKKDYMLQEVNDLGRPSVYVNWVGIGKEMLVNKIWKTTHYSQLVVRDPVWNEICFETRP